MISLHGSNVDSVHALVVSACFQRQEVRDDEGFLHHHSSSTFLRCIKPPSPPVDTFCLCPSLASLPLYPFSVLPCLSSSHSHFLLYPPVFYYPAPVISLDIKKYTSTEQLCPIKKNRSSPGPCERRTVDARRRDEEEASESAHLGSGR